MSGQRSRPYLRALIWIVAIAMALVIYSVYDNYVRHPILSRVFNLLLVRRAMEEYKSVHGCVPPLASADESGQPLLSWRVHLLPFLGPEGEQLYRRFRLDEPWNSPNNLSLVEEMPAVYAYIPTLYERLRNKKPDKGKTRLLAIAGKGSAWDLLCTSFPEPKGRMGAFIAPIGCEVIWTAPEDWQLDSPPQSVATERVGRSLIFGVTTKEIIRGRRAAVPHSNKTWAELVHILATEGVDQILE